LADGVVAMRVYVAWETLEDDWRIIYAGDDKNQCLLSRQETIDKGYLYVIEVWENGVKLCSFTWDEDWDEFSPSSDNGFTIESI
jgi:hypothetical protein